LFSESGGQSDEDLVFFISSIEWKPIKEFASGAFAPVDGQNLETIHVSTVQLADTIDTIAPDAFTGSGVVQVNIPSVVAAAIGTEANTALENELASENISVNGQSQSDTSIVRVSPKTAVI
jgi:hypothetical protein